jgi:tetratricopeptide (TPR) repeat protein
MSILRFRLLAIAVLSVANFEFAAAADVAPSCKSIDRYHYSLEAFEICNRALNDMNLTKPIRAELLFARAEAAYYLGKFGLALTGYNEAIALNPNFTEAYLRRAWTRNRLGFYADSLEDITTVLSREPSNADALFALGIYHSDTEEWPTKAVQIYKQVLELDPNHHLARLNLANIYRVRYGTYREAIAEYDRILEASDSDLQSIKIFIEPGIPNLDFRGRVRLKRADSMAQLGHYPEALAELDRLVLAYPKMGNVLAVRAETYNDLRKFNEAYADARLAVELEPNAAPQMVSLVRALYGLGKHDKAISTADQFVSGPLELSFRGRILFWRGYANKALGNKQDALEDFEESMFYDRWNVAALLTQLIQNGYYRGEVTDAYSQQARNGLQACIIDPRCGG